MSSLPPEPISSRAPEAISSSRAPARARMVSILSSARSTAMPTSAMSSEMPVRDSPILVWASAAVYWALIVSFWVRKASTLAVSFCSVGDQLVLLALELLALDVEVLQLLLRPALRSRATAGQVLAALLQRRPGLVVELLDALLDLGRLEVEPLPAGGDVRHSATHFLQHFELLLVGVVERLARILGPVQHLAGLRLDDRREPAHEAHRSGSLLPSWTEVRG